MGERTSWKNQESWRLAFGTQILPLGHGKPEEIKVHHLQTVSICSTRPHEEPRLKAQYDALDPEANSSELRWLLCFPTKRCNLQPYSSREGLGFDSIRWIDGQTKMHFGRRQTSLCRLASVSGRENCHEEKKENQRKDCRLDIWRVSQVDSVRDEKQLDWNTNWAQIQILWSSQWFGLHWIRHWNYQKTACKSHLAAKSKSCKGSQIGRIRNWRFWQSSTKSSWWRSILTKCAGKHLRSESWAFSRRRLAWTRKQGVMKR